MSAVVSVARKELRDAVGSRWLIAYAVLFAGLALALSYLGARNLGSVGFENFSRTTASLLNLCLLLAPLAALTVASGAIAGNRERGALANLLAQPLDRWELLAGTYLGLTASIGLATAFGFGAAGVVIALQTSALDVATYALFLVLVVALIAVMNGIGLAISAAAADRSQALGIAVLSWFVAVFVFDLLLIGAVSSTSLHGGGLLAALLLNPIEIVRLLAIVQLEPDLQILGPFGSYLVTTFGTTGATVLLGAALAIWIALPLTVAALVFEARDP